jgi:hypothetical protein
VAITTIDAVIADVMFVTELNWLLSFKPLARVPGGTIKLNGYPQSSNHDEQGTVDGDFCQRVSTVVKNLWHRRRINRELKYYERDFKLQIWG